MEPLAFADSLGIDQGTSASLTDEDGNENTYSLFNNEEVQSPIAIKSFDLWSYGQSAYIPSVRQLSYLFAVRYQINECITEVGGTPINLNPSECWLWSSPEAWRVNGPWILSYKMTVQDLPSIGGSASISNCDAGLMLLSVFISDYSFQMLNINKRPHPLLVEALAV